MNCVRCGLPLEANARFCRNCGQPVAPSQSQLVLASPPEEQMSENIIPISSPVEQLNSPSSYPQQTYQQQQAHMSPQNANTLPIIHSAVSTAHQSSNVAQPPANYYQPAREASGEARSTVVNAPRRRNRAGCVLGCLGTLLILALVLVAAWIFALRPYMHDVAMTQMDNAMTNAVNQIPAVGLPIAPGTTFPISDNTINTLLTNNGTDSNVVQSTNVQVTSNAMLLTFKLYGQTCTITSIPQMHNGKLVATNVAVSGIVSLVLSPTDVTTLLNKHLDDVQTRINHRVTKVRLLDHEIDVTVE
ncbi:MAG: hypothetical protein NVSMB54_27910 [Ktedonobacteraceae bacterium]